LHISNIKVHASRRNRLRLVTYFEYASRLMRKLISIKKLSDETEIPVRTLRSFVTGRKIPFLKCGHRTILFDRQKVEAALEAFEVEAVGAK